MVRCMTGQMDNLTRQVTELECFVVLEIDIEGIFEHGRIIKTIDWGKSLLNLADSLADADCYVTAKLLFQVLSCCEMIGMGMGFPETESKQDRNNKAWHLQNLLHSEPILFNIGEKTVGCLGGDRPRRRIIVQH